jgi:hypothetical protein
MADNETLEQMTGISEGRGGPEPDQKNSGTLGLVSNLAEAVGDFIVEGALDLASGAARVGQSGGEVVLNATVNVGGTVIEGLSQAGSAVAETAPAVAEAAVDVVGTVIGGLLDS